MEPEELASQLRRPTGEGGIEIGNVMNELNGCMSSFVYNHMNVSENDQILEIEFGNGKLIPEILNKATNVSYTDIDLSDDMVREATVFIRCL
ncbi:MAG: hypothetical protein HRT71_01165 [Flavobacteriales bacterium]|nr:hypothetical protein [Flavobacteriales bacterium]